jgi:hypothetical protein
MLTGVSGGTQAQRARDITAATLREVDMTLMNAMSCGENSQTVFQVLPWRMKK